MTNPAFPWWKCGILCFMLRVFGWSDGWDTRKEQSPCPLGSMADRDVGFYGCCTGNEEKNPSGDQRRVGFVFTTRQQLSVGTADRCVGFVFTARQE